MMKYIQSWFTVVLLACFSSCGELNYDPSWDDATPCDQVTPWTKRGNGVQKAETCNFPLSDLSDTMPLAKILDIALFNNPRTQVNWQAARAAAFGLRASYSNYYPSVSFTETLEVANDTIGIGKEVGISTTTTTSGITASSTSSTVGTLTSELIFNFLLFDFGGRASQVEYAAGLLFAANWQHNLDIQQVLLNVLTAYTSYLGNQGLVEADKLDLKDAEEALKASEKMFAAGLVTKTDVLQANAIKSQKLLALIQAESAESTSLGQLAVTMGLPPQTKFTVEELPQKLPVIESAGDIADLFELAKKRRPDLGIAVAAIKEQEAQLGISYSAGMPTLSAFGLMNHTHFIHSPILDGHLNAIGLQINAPVFQGFYYVNQQKQIRAQIAEAVAALDLQVTQVALDLVSSYYSLKSAEAQIPVTMDYLEYSERAYKGVLFQYKVGSSSILDVINALTILSDARAAVVTARTGWALATATLAFSVGILNDTDLKEVPVKSKEEIALESSIQASCFQPQRGYLFKAHSAAPLGQTMDYIIDHLVFSPEGATCLKPIVLPQRGKLWVLLV